MKILVSNDDGVGAKGINYLAKALADVADITVVAPDRDRSGASNSLTLTSPLRIATHANGFIGVEGTPTDCVHLAITGLLDEKWDMVVSGINDGGNLGDDVLYSGTVAAAMEGRYLGYPALAVSLVGELPTHFDTAAQVTKNIIKNLQENPLPRTTILNINVPDVPFEQLEGIEVTRLGKRHCAEPVVVQTDPRGRTVYWIGPAGQEADAGLGTDFNAVRHNRVSITPLQLDLTHYEGFGALADWASHLQGHSA